MEMAYPDRTSLDGYTGSLYQQPFDVPTYDNTSSTFDVLSWQDIDLFYQSNASSVVLNAVGFTICLVSFLYVVALTPSSKRRLRIHTYLVLALIFKMIDRGIAISLLLHSPNVSAYINLTLDVGHIDISSNFRARVAALQVGAILTFVCLQVCLYTHGKPLLLSIRMRQKAVYCAMLTYLVMTGVLALALRSALMVMILVNLDEPLGPTGAYYHAIYQATIIAFAISIASWSLVFFCTSVKIIIQRRRQFISRNKLYESVLNMIAIIGLESFIVPLLIAILQLVPRINAILSNSPEVLLIPSVLLVLPLASVFGSSRGGHLAASNSSSGRCQIGSDSSRVAIIKTDDFGANDRSCLARGDVNLSHSHATAPVQSAPRSGSQDLVKKTDLNPIDVELRLIDEM